MFECIFYFFYGFAAQAIGPKPFSALFSKVNVVLELVVLHQLATKGLSHHSLSKRVPLGKICKVFREFFKMAAEIQKILTETLTEQSLLPKGV